MKKARKSCRRSSSACGDDNPILKRSRAVLRGGLLLQRYGIGLILRRLLIQQCDEFADRSRNAHLAYADNLLGNQILAIEFLVRTAVRPERRALQQSPRTIRVSENSKTSLLRLTSEYRDHLCLTILKYFMVTRDVGQLDVDRY